MSSFAQLGSSAYSFTCYQYLCYFHGELFITSVCYISNQLYDFLGAHKIMYAFNLKKLRKQQIAAFSKTFYKRMHYDYMSSGSFHLVWCIPYNWYLVWSLFGIVFLTIR